jgi:2-polyprenyl-6-methoxyphenol hydroxylase-like FAD-dependent oxidoreductase
MWGVSRVVLDGLLIDEARRAGAAVIQPARVESVEPGTRPAVRVRDLPSNTIDRLESDVLLVADGKSALVNGGPPPPTGDLGIKTHFENVAGPRDAVELFGLSDCYGGLAPIEGDRWNAALSVPAARVRHHRGDLGCLFAELVQENPTLRRRLAGARQCGAWLASPLPRFSVRTHWPQGVIPLGNAAAAIEPIGGEGMGLAIRSAELAVAELCKSPDGGTIQAQYRQLWRVRASACRAAGRLASDRRWSPRAAMVLGAVPGLLRAGTAVMGK